MQPNEDTKTAENGDTSEIHKARQGLLKALQRNFAPKFSSTPITVRKTMGGEAGTGIGEVATIATDTALPAPETAAAVIDHMENKLPPLIAGNHSVLTESEKLYLEALLQSNDPALLLTASQTLNDATLFPPHVDPVRKGGDDENGRTLSLSEQEQQHQPQDNDEADGGSGGLASPVHAPFPEAEAEIAASTANPRTAIKHRDSGLQQQLFRLHEMTNSSAKPSQVLQRMSLMSQRNNSILASEEDVVSGLGLGSGAGTGTGAGAGAGGAGSEQLAAAVAETLASGAWDMEQDQSEEPKELEDFGVGDWNPFKDISSWLDGSQGIEVSDNGVPTPTEALRTKARSFKILGTSADDLSCHPHVLSPPAMESLTAFIPDTLSDQNFWLKYSLIRDGASLWKMLRQVRASTNSILAIETTDGHVFGAFTTQSWRFSQGWYGSKESFLWKMRNARSFETTTRSIVEQACQEGEIQVFPYRVPNVAVQYCSKDYLMLGQGELLPATNPGQHYGYGLYLDADLLKGSTSTSETFGNPCMVDAGQRGARFDVANIEVWSFTPHATVEEAVQSELSTLFLEGGRNANDKKLNVLGILVGDPI